MRTVKDNDGTLRRRCSDRGHTGGGAVTCQTMAEGADLGHIAIGCADTEALAQASNLSFLFGPAYGVIPHLPERPAPDAADANTTATPVGQD